MERAAVIELPVSSSNFIFNLPQEEKIYIFTDWEVSSIWF